MPEEKLTRAEVDDGRRIFAMSKAAEYIITHTKTDNTAVLLASAHAYTEAQVAAFAFWDQLFETHPKAYNDGVSIDWGRGVIKWPEPESSAPEAQPPVEADKP